MVIAGFARPMLALAPDAKQPGKLAESSLRSSFQHRCSDHPRAADNLSQRETTPAEADIRQNRTPSGRRWHFQVGPIDVREAIRNLGQKSRLVKPNEQFLNIDGDSWHELSKLTQILKSAQSQIIHAELVRAWAEKASHGQATLEEAVVPGLAPRETCSLVVSTGPSVVATAVDDRALAGEPPRCR